MRRLLLMVGCVFVAVLASVPRPASGSAVVDVLFDQLGTVRDLVGGLTPDLTRGPDQTLRWYLLALVTRNRDLRNAVVAPASETPTVGPSSPWVYRADVKGEAQASPCLWSYTVALGLANSTGPVALRTERIDVSDVFGRYLVTGIEVDGAMPRRPRSSAPTAAAHRACCAGTSCAR